MPTKLMGPPPTMYNTRGTYPAPAYAHPGTVAIIERPGPLNRTISARQAHPVSIHTGRIQYNPNGGAPLSARRTLKPSVVQSDSEEEEEEEPEQTQLQRKQVALRQRPVQAIESETESESEEEDEEDEEEGEEEEEDSEEDEEDEEEDAAIEEAERRRRLLQLQRQNAPAELARRIAEAEARNLAQIRHQEQLLQQQRMPPPVMPASLVQQKLSMRKANPAPQITYGGRRPSMHDHDDVHRPGFRDLSVGTSANRRPSQASSGVTKATSHSHPNATGNVRVTIEGSRGRRLSYVGAEDHAGLAAMHAQFAPPQQAAPDLELIVANAVRQQMDKLQLTPTQTGHSKVNLDDRMQEALRYQQGIDANAPRTRDIPGNLPHVPLTAEALRRKQNIPSHTGSARSTRSSDEDRTRISASHRLTAGSDSGAVTVADNEMKLRIDPYSSFEMEFEGRKVTLLPAGDGTAELIIGGKRETPYFSALDSTINGSRVGGSKIGRAPTTREPPREYVREPNREYAREPIREYAREPATREYIREPPPREYTREPTTREYAREPSAREYTREPIREYSRDSPREIIREPTRDPRERDPRDREPRDREAERVRERIRERRDREDRRQQARERTPVDYADDFESETEYDEPPRRRVAGRPRAETYESERAAPTRRAPPGSPRHPRLDRVDRDERDDRYDDHPPQRRSRQEPPYAPGPSQHGYNGRGPSGPPSAAVFGA
jgi:hypothetical protein